MPLVDQRRSSNYLRSHGVDSQLGPGCGWGQGRQMAKALQRSSWRPFPTHNPHNITINWAVNWARRTCLVLNQAGKGGSRPRPSYLNPLPSPFPGRGLSSCSFPEPSLWLPSVFSSGRVSCLSDCPLQILFTTPLTCHSNETVTQGPLFSVHSGVSRGESSSLLQGCPCRTPECPSTWVSYPSALFVGYLSVLQAPETPQAQS